MEITGRIIQVLPERRGTSNRTGTEWVCGSYVLETMEQYPRKMCFEVFGSDRMQQFAIQAGETMVVSFDIDAHEYQGRWFNSIRAWKVDRNLASATGAAPAAGDVPFGAAPANVQTPFPNAQAAPAAAPQMAAPAQPAASAQPAAAPAAPFASQDDGEGLPF